MMSAICISLLEGMFQKALIGALTYGFLLLSQPSSVDTSYSIVAEAEKKLLDLKEHTTKIVSSIIVKQEKLCRLELERGRHQSF